MKYLSLISAILFLVICGMGSLSAQSQFDLESRTGIELTKKMGKNIVFKFDNQVRFKDLLTKFDRLQTEISIGYKFKRKYQLSYGLRYYFRYDNQGTKTGARHYMRFNWDVSKKLDYDRLDFVFRYRYQRRHQLGVDETLGDYPAIDHRVKMKTSYNIKDWKWDPTFSIEGFWHFERGAYNGYNKARYTIGTSRKYTKNGTLKIKLAMERESRVWKPQIDFLTMLTWSQKI